MWWLKWRVLANSRSDPEWNYTLISYVPERELAEVVAEATAYELEEEETLGYDYYFGFQKELVGEDEIPLEEVETDISDTGRRVKEAQDRLTRLQALFERRKSR